MTDEERRKLAETLRTAKPDVLTEIVREAESFLAEQLKAGLASDQRAINTAVYLAAVLAAVVGGTATLVSVKTELGLHVIGLIWLAGCLAFALAHAVLAARPTPFHYSGTNPVRWVSDINEGRPLHDSLAGQAAIYAQGIRSNARCLEEGQSYLKISLRAAAVGTIGFAVYEIVVSLSMIAKNGLPL